MPPTIDMAAILALPPSDRLAVADAIWDSLAAEETQDELSPEMKAELDRRLAAADAAPGAVVSWDEVYAAALARHKS